MLFFGNYFGHRDIVIKSTRTGRVEALIEDALDESEMDPIFQYPVVEVSPLEAGEYEIYTTDHNHTERSKGIRIVLTGDSMFKQLERCSDLAKADAKEYLDEEKHDLPKDLTVLPYLLKLYQDSASYAKKQAYTQLLLAVVDMMNRRFANEELTAWDMTHDCSDDSVMTDVSCNHVIRRNLLTGEMRQLAMDNLDQKIEMAEEYESLYLYTQIDETGLPINFCFAFCPDPIIYGFLKEDMEHAKDLYQRAVEKAVGFSEDYEEFSQEELPILKIVDELQPDIPFLHVPTLFTEFGFTTATFTEEDIQILSLFPDTFNLAINPPEYALDPTQRVHLRIPGKDFRFYSEQYGLMPGDYLCWVEDDFHHIVSDIQVLHLNSGAVNPGYAESGINEEFNERLRKAELKKYEKHLKPYVKANYPRVMEQVQNAVSYCQSATTCGVQDIAHTIIEQCLLYDNMTKLPDIISSVMRDRTVYGDYVVNFFETPLRYKYDDFTLVLPPESGVLYRIERYSYVKGRTVEYFAAKRLEAIDYHFYDCDFAVFSAVDVRTGKSSGFLLFDFDYNHEGRTKVTRFLLEAKEVRK